LLTQQQHIRKRLKEVELCFLENEGWLHRVENDVKLLGQDSQPPVVRQLLEGSGDMESLDPAVALEWCGIWVILFMYW
jgi:hypothetical protein